MKSEPGEERFGGSGAASAFSSRVLDTVRIHRNQCKLSRDKESVGDDEENDGEKTERSVDNAILLSGLIASAA
jgi:hypothetical protein